MKEITVEEQKKILIDILKYIDRVCRENNIKYTLIGGSLIGAVRHQGIIPWDDDIDIGLLSKEYDKLIQCLKESDDSRFRLLDVDTEPTYYYPFAKLVDTRTIVYEDNYKTINNYGVYVDIFKYCAIPDNYEEITKHYKKVISYKKRIARSVRNHSDNTIKNMIYQIRCKADSTKIARKYIKYCEQYNHKISKRVMSNWPVYGFKGDIQLRSSFNYYIDMDFEDMKAMVIKDYDTFLTTTFGDYMTLPPVEKRVSQHNMKMYWSDK